MAEAVANAQDSNRITLKYDSSTGCSGIPTLGSLLECGRFVKVEFPDNSAKWYGYVISYSIFNDNDYFIIDRDGHGFECIKIFNNDAIVTLFGIDTSVCKRRDDDYYESKLTRYRALRTEPLPAMPTAPRTYFDNTVAFMPNGNNDKSLKCDTSCVESNIVHKVIQRGFENAPVYMTYKSNWFNGQNWIRTTNW